MQKFNYTPSNPFSGSVSSLAIGAGMVVVPLAYPFGIRNFYVADPEGNLLEIGSTDLYRLS